MEKNKLYNFIMNMASKAGTLKSIPSFLYLVVIKLGVWKEIRGTQEGCLCIHDAVKPPIPIPDAVFQLADIPRSPIV